MRLTPHHPRRRRAVALAGVTSAVALLTAGCSGYSVTQTLSTGWLPSTRDTTDETERIINLWNGSWIAALVVGFIVWGLILWCVVAYRRRKDEVGLPAQLRYNVPLEIMYTVIPLIMVGVLFFYTARDQEAIEDVVSDPDVRINVVGKQWAWDFNYLDAGVYEATRQVTRLPDGSAATDLPALYLPVDQTVELDLTTRDVNHSFWVPEFLYKKDLIAGRTNVVQLTPTREGVFRGRCAELCGQYHSEMLFEVHVVSEEEFEAHMAALRAAGQVGRLDQSLDRNTSDSDREDRGSQE